jgi:hypothetical protein
LLGVRFVVGGVGRERSCVKWIRVKFRRWPRQQICLGRICGVYRLEKVRR